jgi:hypothetical protein
MDITVAIIRTWPQCSPSDADLQIVTKIVSENETVDDIMEWAKKYGTGLNVTLVRNQEGKPQ